MGLCPRGSFEDLVFRLVLFHQSLEGNPEHPSLVVLTEEEQYAYCDPRLYELMKILLIHDGGSYTLFASQENREKQTNAFV